MKTAQHRLWLSLNMKDVNGHMRSRWMQKESTGNSEIVVIGINSADNSHLVYEIERIETRSET